MATTSPAHIDREGLNTNLHTRVSYLVNFIGLTSDDVQALKNTGPLIRPALKGIAEAMCESRPVRSLSLRTRGARPSVINADIDPPFSFWFHLSDKKLWSYDVTRASFENTTNPDAPKDKAATQEEKRKYLYAPACPLFLRGYLVLTYLVRTCSVSFTYYWILKIFVCDWQDLKVHLGLDYLCLGVA